LAIVTIPGVIKSTEELFNLDKIMLKFGNARRRAFSMKKKGFKKSVIEKILQLEIGLNSRYVKDAWYSIKDLPINTTFGGLNNQLLREKGKISKSEYKKRRNAILLSRGDKSKKGNLNLRIDFTTLKLRINTCNCDIKWLFIDIFIPHKFLDKYGSFLDGSYPYTVLIRRRNFNSGYDVRINIEVTCEIRKASRVMALDINAGHTDFAVMKKSNTKLLAIGKINHHETQHVRKGKREHLLNKTVEKIGNIAQHYDAEVVVGHLNTGKFKSYNKKATRKIRQMPQYKFRKLLKRLERKGIKINERSEAYTSKLGHKVSQLVGLDVHKCAAILFALKVINYDLFRQLMKYLSGVSSDEGNGSRKRKQGRESGLTAPIQYRMFPNKMKFWMVMKSRIEDRSYLPNPGREGLSFLDNLKANFPCLNVKIW